MSHPQSPHPSANSIVSPLGSTALLTSLFVPCTSYMRTKGTLSHPEAAEVLGTNAYVDGIICSEKTVEDARKLQTQLVQLLKKSRFKLRKWMSDSQNLLCTLPEVHCDITVFLENSVDRQFSILGLFRSPTSDVFSYNLEFSSATPTKRHVLSIVARIYDPCGFLAPCVMTTNCLIQLLWTSGLQWDESLTRELAAKWDVSSLSSLSSLSIPCSIQLSSSTNIQLYGFSDTSEVTKSAMLL